MYLLGPFATIFWILFVTAGFIWRVRNEMALREKQKIRGSSRKIFKINHPLKYKAQ